MHYIRIIIYNEQDKLLIVFCIEFRLDAPGLDTLLNKWMRCGNRLLFPGMAFNREDHAK